MRICGVMRGWLQWQILNCSWLSLQTTTHAYAYLTHKHSGSATLARQTDNECRSTLGLWARDAKHVSSFVGNESSRRRHCLANTNDATLHFRVGVCRGVPGGRGSDAPVKVRAMDVRLKILWRLGTAEQGRVKLQLTTLKLRTGWIQRRAWGSNSRLCWLSQSIGSMLKLGVGKIGWWC